MNQRELAELRSLFGRFAVDDAIAYQSELKRWSVENARLVADASSELMKVIHNPPEAVAYVAGLDPQLKGALIVAILSA